jgi:hypothetical protein
VLSTKQKISYFRLRKQIFVHEVKHWLQQVQHLLVLTVIFLGTALPALFYGALLGYGIILDNKGSVLHSLMIAWSIMVVQCIILLLSKSAILGSRYQYFLLSIQIGRVKSFAVDAWFALLCSPFLIMLGVILLSIELEYMSKFLHGFVLFFIQLALIFACLYRVKTLVWFLALCLLSNVLIMGDLLPVNIKLASALIFYAFLLLVIFVMSLLTKSLAMPTILTLPIQYNIWLTMTLSSQSAQSNGNRSANKMNSFLMCAAFCAILLMMGSYSESNLPAFKNIVHFITGQLLVLACIGLQLSIDKTVKVHALFFEQYKVRDKWLLAQYWVSLSVALFVLATAALLFSAPIMLLHVLALVFSLLFLKRYSAFLMVAWLCSSAILGLIVFV